MEDELAEIRDELGRLIDRLDDLVYDAIARQLHGEAAKDTEKQLSRARNALRRGLGLLGPLDGDPFGGA